MEVVTRLLARIGMISLDTPIKSSIPVPENGCNTSGWGLNRRILKMLFAFMRLIATDGGGKFVPTWP